MRFALWSDGEFKKTFFCDSIGKAIVKAYKMEDGCCSNLKILAEDGTPGKTVATFSSGRNPVLDLASMSPEDVLQLNGDSFLRRKIIAEIVENGIILESEYGKGEHDRNAVQLILYQGKVFTFHVACGCRQFENTEPKMIHGLGIPQDLRKVE
ncbi:hypothetical protein TALC_00362 [Thermoplasmatales archaeon BRNA1]|nr:hypothetical protein TALC_00362 [Thermoplasmatales archaeon BRNA1]